MIILTIWESCNNANVIWLDLPDKWHGMGVLNQKCHNVLRVVITEEISSTFCSGKQGIIDIY